MKKWKKIMLLLCSLMFVLSVCIQNTTASSTMQSLFDETLVVHGAEQNGKKAVYGIDVSYHQGRIDWKKVKAAGIEFAFIRLGGSSLSDGVPYLDSMYSYNVREARAAGVKIGVYFFSQATNSEEVKREVDFIAANLNGLQLDLPVVYDAERCPLSNQQKGYFQAADLSKEQWTNLTIEFCEGVRAMGYEPMFYSGISEIMTRIDYRTISSRYKMWIARYKYKGNTTPHQLITANYPYTGKYDFWQYSDHGRVDGINTYVDLNIMYASADSSWKGTVYYNSRNVGSGSGLLASVSGSNVNLKWNSAENATSYQIYRSENYQKSFQMIAEVESTTYTDVNRVLNKEYYYYIVPCGTVDGGVKKGDSSSIIRTYCAGTAVGNLKVNASISLRKEASTSVSSLVKLPKGATVTGYCETKGTDGNVWMKIRYKKGKTSYVGYVRASRLTPVVSKISNLRKVSCSANTVTLTWNKVSGATGYQIYKSNARNGKFTKIATVEGDSNVEYTVGSLAKNTIYYYKVRAYKTVAGRTGYSSYSLCSGGTTPDRARAVKAKRADYLRQYAGTAYKKLVKVPKNAKLKVVWTTRDNKNRVWYKVEYTKGKKKYTGFFLKSNTR